MPFPENLFTGVVLRQTKKRSMRSLPRRWCASKIAQGVFSCCVLCSRVPGKLNHRCCSSTTLRKRLSIIQLRCAPSRPRASACCSKYAANYGGLFMPHHMAFACFSVLADRRCAAQFYIKICGKSVFWGSRRAEDVVREAPRRPSGGHLMQRSIFGPILAPFREPPGSPKSVE